MLTGLKYHRRPRERAENLFCKRQARSERTCGSRMVANDGLSSLRSLGYANPCDSPVRLILVDTERQGKHAANENEFNVGLINQLCNILSTLAACLTGTKVFRRGLKDSL